MDIQKLFTHNMRNDAHFQFHTEFRDLVEKHGAAALKIKPQFDAYLPLYEREDIALKKIIKSALTAQIHEADKARDEVYAVMVKLNAVLTRHFNADVRKAAAQLKIVFDTYGDVVNKPLNEETSALYNVLQDLQGKYAADVTAAGIGEWVEELKARNEAFESLMKERFDETTARTDIVLREARAEADEAYFAICRRVNALAEIEGVTAYEAFVRSLNTVIAKYAEALHHHRHHKHAAQTEVPNV